ncbi:MAG: hypothetical protein HDT12_00250 [Helicobacter sp.]|nr:hypothetical protein [Helicobacter sp.]
MFVAKHSPLQTAQNIAATPADNAQNMRAKNNKNKHKEKTMETAPKIIKIAQ